MRLNQNFPNADTDTIENTHHGITVVKISRLRVSFQLLLHLLLVGHVLAYYFLEWRSVGALDFQTFFHHLLGEGLLTAGALLTLLVYGSALLFGRLFCSWGCHFGATQDLAAWVLRKLRWRPPLVRTRFLHWFPLFFLVVIFLVPVASHWRSSWQPGVNFAAVGPWDTLPGWFLSVVTFAACGVGILFFLGTRGFCRFVCPYGALFRFTDKIAPFRVRKVAACAGSSCQGNQVISTSPVAHVPPCTAACPTAIDVHRETSATGAVTSVDCVRCHLCIEACPQDALALRFRPAATTQTAADPGLQETGPDAAVSQDRLHPPAYKLPVWGEGLVAVVTVSTYFLVDLVYGGHFLAATLALGEGFLAYVVGTAVRRDGEVTVLGAKLRSERGLSFVGVTAIGLLALSVIPLFEAGAFKWCLHRAVALDPAPRAEEADAQPALSSTPAVTSQERVSLEKATRLYERAARLFPNHAQTNRLLLSAYVRLRDRRRAVRLAERLDAESGGRQDVRETLRQIYLLFGEVDRARRLPPVAAP